jgi:hypothetical protein
MVKKLFIRYSWAVPIPLLDVRKRSDRPRCAADSSLRYLFAG